MAKCAGLCPAVRRGYAQVAQLVEHVTENHGVGGSIPPLGTTLKSLAKIVILVRQGKPLEIARCLLADPMRPFRKVEPCHREQPAHNLALLPIHPKARR